MVEHPSNLFLRQLHSKPLDSCHKRCIVVTAELSPPAVAHRSTHDQVAEASLCAAASPLLASTLHAPVRRTSDDETEWPTDQPRPVVITAQGRGPRPRKLASTPWSTYIKPQPHPHSPLQSY